MTINDRIDSGKRVHHRIHSDFSLEVTEGLVATSSMLFQYETWL